MFDDLLDANRRYRAGFHDSGVSGTAAKGLAVLTCIDSRIDPLALLGLSIGDAKIIRNAGRVSPMTRFGRWCSRSTCSASTACV